VIPLEDDGELMQEETRREGTPAAHEADAHAPAAERRKAGVHRGPLAKAEEKIGALEAEVGELREKYLRALADYDNFRKRAEKERAEIYKSAAERLIGNLLEVLDGFDQALAADPTSAGESFLEGLALLRQHFLAVLEREGLSPIEAEGQPFDPHLHEAVLQVDSDELPPGTVVEEIRKGYLLNARLLRPARVTVAK
jgi:molecular chaperone GrpE